MSSGRSDRGSSRHSAGLLLRVGRADGHAEEVYLAPNLTIGRSVANSVVLADDESVDRTHARVEVAEDGTARLRCVEPDSTLTADGVAVRELPLDVGVRFRIGRAEFECVSGRRGAEGEPQRSWSTCPFCGSAAVPTTGEGARPCPDCNNPVIPIPLDPHSPDSLLVPAVYGAYRGNRYVARGGMGLVLMGTREGGGEAVAIKVLLPGTIPDRRDAERFGQEVAMLERVRHPNVVKLLDHGTAGRCHYLVLEWVEGPSLREVIAEARRAGKLTDFADASRWFEQLCKGLAAVHAVGVVHRDLKPSNILIGPDRAARVADLGIARRVDDGHTAYTATGQAPGTFEYMAPEQLGAPDTVDGRADLYALGVTFYELLTGTRPVGAWRPASDLNPNVPVWFDAILNRLLAADRERRTRDIYELISSCSTREPEAASARKRHPKPIWSPWLIGAGLLLFGPLWSGFLSALNWWNMARPSKAWKPIVIALVAVGMSAFADAMFPESFDDMKAFVFIQLPTLALLVYADLIPQHQVYRQHRAAGGERRKVLLPIVAGIIFAIAVRITDQALSWSADRAGEAYERGYALAQKGRLDDAIAAYTRTIEYAPDAVEAYQARGAAYLDKGELEKAASDFSQVLRLDPHQADAYRLRGQTFLWKGDYDLAITDCNEAIRRAPSLAAAYFIRGCAYHSKGDPDQALRDLDDYIRMGPKDALGYYMRGLAHAAKGRADRALADLDQAIRLKPDNAGAYAARANIHRQAGRLDQAVADYKEAIRLDPTDTESLAARADILISQKQYDLALADANKLIELVPQNADGYCLRSRVHFVAARYDKALADAEQAVQLEPGSAQPYNFRALGHVGKLDHKAAISDLSKAIELAPDHAGAYFLRSSCYTDLGDKTRAEADYQRAIQLDPSLAK